MMMRALSKAAIAGLLFCAELLPSWAGDSSELNVLGFTADGKIFAFEEFGIQDGSGFPYADRFYVDVAADKFLANTPIRVRIDQDGANLADARRQAADAAAKLMPDAKFTPGYLAAFNAVTEDSADPFNLLANPRPIFPPIDPPVAIKLEEIDVPPPASCKDLGKIKGFRLIKTSPAKQSAVVSEDATIPASRRCPEGYRLGGLVTFYPEGGVPVFAVMIIVRGVGFEGPDHRWIAVTGKL